jgi:hypothetical protein
MNIFLSVVFYHWTSNPYYNSSVYKVNKARQSLLLYKLQP